MRYMLNMSRVFLLLALFITACTPVTPAHTATETLTLTASTPTARTDAQQYLSDALDIIQNNALNSSKVDWSKTRATAFDRENDALTSAATYDTIQWVLQQLGDHHSLFLTPDDANQMKNSKVEDYPAPTGRMIKNNIGYVSVSEFNAQGEDEMNKYGDQIQSLIIDLKKESACGWIVDLRDDLGGNMYPMIAGLGALMGEGNLGSSKDAKGNLSHWFYRNGVSGEGTEPIAKVSHPEFLLDPEQTPVAVLIGPKTASSGEATALSFRGRPSTRFFGKPLYGLTTGNAPFPLSDGAIIILTSVVELDRTGKEYGGSITPEVDTSDAEAAAINWLVEQPACKP